MATTPCIRWVKPPNGWIKINSDGATATPSRTAGAGGVLRDTMGKWILGYNRNIGRCGTIQAELWGILDDLKIAWGWNFKKVILECDSSSAVNWILSDDRSDHDDPLVDSILELINRPWYVLVQHTPREANQIADMMAKSVSLSVRGLHIIMEPPTEALPVLKSDETGHTYKRHIA